MRRSQHQRHLLLDWRTNHQLLRFYEIFHFRVNPGSVSWLLRIDYFIMNIFSLFFIDQSDFYAFCMSNCFYNSLSWKKRKLIDNQLSHFGLKWRNNGFNLIINNLYFFSLQVNLTYFIILWQPWTPMYCKLTEFLFFELTNLLVNLLLPFQGLTMPGLTKVIFEKYTTYMYFQKCFCISKLWFFNFQVSIWLRP